MGFSCLQVFDTVSSPVIMDGLSYVEIETAET